MSECDDCENYIELISDMRKYMSIGSFAQRTPRYIILEFKDLMKRANAVHRQRLLLDKETTDATES
jgi:hypothetical protein